MEETKYTRYYEVLKGTNPKERPLLVDCMDRRFAVQRPAGKWTLSQTNALPSLLTKFAPVRHLMGSWAGKEVASLVRSVRKEIKNRNATSVIITAHATCAGNAGVSNDDQKVQLAKVYQKFVAKFPGVRIITLFNDKLDKGKWLIEPQNDSSGEFAPIGAEPFKKDFSSEYEVFPLKGECTPVLITCSEPEFSVQLPSGKWVAEFLDLPYVVAKEAPARRLAHAWSEVVSFVDSIEFAIDHAHADTIVVTAHQDCHENEDASDRLLLAELEESVRKLSSRWPKLRIVAVFITHTGEIEWRVDPVFDSKGEFATDIPERVMEAATA